MMKMRMMGRSAWSCLRSAVPPILMIKTTHFDARVITRSPLKSTAPARDQPHKHETLQ